MNFQEYQNAIEKFCIYPDIGPHGLVYPVLGLIGEIGECFLEQKGEGTGLINRSIDQFELGDVFFYVARCLSHVNETVSLDVEYRKYLIYAMEENIILSSHKIAEHLKKLIRDNNSKKLDSIVHLIKEITWDLARISYKLGQTPERIMQMNYGKLQSRLERDVIKGDGDNR